MASYKQVESRNQINPQSDLDYLQTKITFLVAKMVASESTHFLNDSLYTWQILRILMII